MTSPSAPSVTTASLGVVLVDLERRGLEGRYRIADLSLDCTGDRHERRGYYLTDGERLDLTWRAESHRPHGGAWYVTGAPWQRPDASYQLAHRPGAAALAVPIIGRELYVLRPSRRYRLDPVPNFTAWELRQVTP